MMVGARHDDLRRRNRALLIAAVRRARRPSRTEIATGYGLSHSTVSSISADLIAEGVLREAPGATMGASKRGRPQVGLELDPDAASVITLSLSLNALSGALVDYAGNTIAEQGIAFETQAVSRQDLVARMRNLVEWLVAPRGGREARPAPKRIVLAIQGVTDSAGRKMLWSPITPHRDLGFADLLESAFDIPASVENDCNMIAQALHQRDPARYGENFLVLLLSHGIGMGLMLKGELFLGTRSSGAEFGHMTHRPGGALCRCGARGCIEAYAGNYAVWRHATTGGDDELPTAQLDEAALRRVAGAARMGDGMAREAYRRAGEALGYGLGSVFSLIDCVPVTLVGAGATAMDLLEPPLRAALARTAGGRDVELIHHETAPDEFPLIRQGCAATALAFVDNEVFTAAGLPGAGRTPRAVQSSRMA